MAHNVYIVNIAVTQINGCFGGFNDIYDHVCVVTTSKEKALQEAKTYILNKHKYLKNLPYHCDIVCEQVYDNIEVVK